MVEFEKELLSVKLRIAKLELETLEQAKEKRQLENVVPSRNGKIWSSQVGVAVVGGIGTLLLALGNNFWQFYTSSEIEKTRLESELILRAVESPDATERKDRLTFLVEAGLVRDKDEKIASLKPGSVPQIEAASTIDASPPRFALVVGGNRDLEAAQNEQIEFQSVGFKDVIIYFRRNTYRTVVPVFGLEDARAQLPKAQKLRTDSYIVNLSNWCPDAVDQDGFLACVAL